MALPPDQNVGSFFVGTLFYGIYLSTLFHCLRWLVFVDEGWKVRKKINWTILSITIIISALLTTYRALDVRDLMMQALDNSQTKPALPPGSIFSNTALSWTEVVKCTNANIMTLLADGVLIYRCWIVYEKSHWVIAFPTFMWMGGLVLTVLQAYWQIVQSASILKAWQPVNMDVGPGTILMPFWLSTIVLNSYATFMIVRRIYAVAKGSEGSASIRQLKFVMRILIESGFLYLSVTIPHFVSWWTPNAYAIDVISAINASMTGIVFNLILIRVAQSRVDERTQSTDLGPISGLKFNVNETKTPAGQFGTDTTEAVTFGHHEDSNSMIHSSTASIV